ncbi:hypothetical protein HER32_12925 [Hymenobacter sp. BT18]|uniref:hypothetical protein n=1 Tax=Hymenobacter sp. BT18 TaxID=2835648 RepID=UPI00143EF3A2|nr:hypothetical protein [Hymenobacter sp. BT18]QIX62039.1 hypothetical protein HER32_12925 [Hymenobacter sp. BT18]
MNSSNFELYGVELVNEQDLMTIEGGHQGTAYAIGHAVGEALVVAGTIIGIAGALLNGGHTS